VQSLECSGVIFLGIKKCYPNLGAKEIKWKAFVQILRNPASDVFFVKTKNIELEHLQLFSITGELLQELIPDCTRTEVETRELAMGIYLFYIIKIKNPWIHIFFWDKEECI
jgi:hypothetical protein